jgi:hypothetical protein
MDDIRFDDGAEFRVVGLARRAAVRLGKELLRLVYRDRPVPLRLLLALRRVGKRRDVLMLRHRPAPAADSLRRRAVGELLGEQSLGSWTLAGDSMNLLDRMITDTRPQTILEFGSGASTVFLAHVLRELHGSRARVLSIEEHASEVERTLEQLDATALRETADVLHVPLAKGNSPDEVPRYALDDALQHEIESLRPTFVLVDGPGPAGGMAGRYATIADIVPVLQRSSLVVLDDALSDNGLRAGILCTKVPGLHVEGIALVGHGLLVGQVESSS